MSESIKENINRPEVLEELYNSDKKQFKEEFEKCYSEIEDLEIASFWKVRLDFLSKVKTKEREGNPFKIQFLIGICFFVGAVIKIPQFFEIETYKSLFYEKNVAVAILFGMTFFWFFRESHFERKKLLYLISVYAFTATYINLLPADRDSDSIYIAYLHIPLMLWSFYGIIYLDFNLKDKLSRMSFIRHNGEILILSVIILISGAVLSGVSVALFSAIGIEIGEFYAKFIVVIGASSTPIVASYILDEHPQITNKIAPIIANIFSPLVLVTLIVFLISFISAGKNPYQDRYVLLVFNLMLFGVMGVIVFAISEKSNKKRQVILFCIVALALIADVIALSAIIYRLGEYGLTPNRIAVLGANLLVFGNLLLILRDLYFVNFNGASIKRVEESIVNYLPIYTGWSIFIGLFLPLIFRMK